MEVEPRFRIICTPFQIVLKISREQAFHYVLLIRVIVHNMTIGWSFYNYVALCFDLLKSFELINFLISFFFKLTDFFKLINLEK